jgi:hypothetical protein
MSATIYVDAEGKRLPSVTTIIGRFKDSGGLLHWANQQGLAGKTLDQARSEATGPGIIVHAMVRDHISGRPVVEPTGESDDEAKARIAYANYLRWETSQKIEFRHVEFPLCSSKYRYGGTFDAIALIGNELCVLDWKCAAAVYADYVLQLAAYQIIWEENYPDHPLIGGAHLCRFSKENGDFSHHHFQDLTQERETFLLMRQLYDSVKQVEKRVK